MLKLDHCVLIWPLGNCIIHLSYLKTTNYELFLTWYDSLCMISSTMISTGIPLFENHQMSSIDFLYWEGIVFFFFSCKYKLLGNKVTSYNFWTWNTWTLWQQSFALPVCLSCTILDFVLWNSVNLDKTVQHSQFCSLKFCQFSFADLLCTFMLSLQDHFLIITLPSVHFPRLLFIFRRLYRRFRTSIHFSSYLKPWDRDKKNKTTEMGERLMTDDGVQQYLCVNDLYQPG